jgi:hypothetical protein
MNEVVLGGLPLGPSHRKQKQMKLGAMLLCVGRVLERGKHCLDSILQLLANRQMIMLWLTQERRYQVNNDQDIFGKCLVFLVEGMQQCVVNSTTNL